MQIRLPKTISEAKLIMPPKAAHHLARTIRNSMGHLAHNTAMLVDICLQGRSPFYSGYACSPVLSALGGFINNGEFERQASPVLKVATPLKYLSSIASTTKKVPKQQKKPAFQLAPKIFNYSLNWFLILCTSAALRVSAFALSSPPGTPCFATAYD